MKICPDCQKNVNENFEFCNGCGCKLNGESESESTEFINVFINEGEFIYLFAVSGRQIVLKSNNIHDLKQKVKENKFVWALKDDYKKSIGMKDLSLVSDSKEPSPTIELDNYILNKELLNSQNRKNINKLPQDSKTQQHKSYGILGVYKTLSKGCEKWAFESENSKIFTDDYLDNLRETVESKGFKWIEFDKSVANKYYELDKDLRNKRIENKKKKKLDQLTNPLSNEKKSILRNVQERTDLISKRLKEKNMDAYF